MMTFAPIFTAFSLPKGSMVCKAVAAAMFMFFIKILRQAIILRPNSNLSLIGRRSLRYYAPNAFLALSDYLEDYVPGETWEKRYALINKSLKEYTDDRFMDKLMERLEKIKKGERDLYF